MLTDSQKQELEQFNCEHEAGQTDYIAHANFCLAMDSHYCPIKDKDFFEHARKEYGYKTQAELEQLYQEEKEESGICRHGLTEDTCPCGCFMTAADLH